MYTLIEILRDLFVGVFDSQLVSLFYELIYSVTVELIGSGQD